MDTKNIATKKIMRSVRNVSAFIRIIVQGFEYRCKLASKYTLKGISWLVANLWFSVLRFNKELKKLGICIKILWIQL